MPDSAKPTRPVVLARCIVEVDKEKRSAPKVQCRVDRERTANPQLQEGMVCETRADKFERGGSLIYRLERICR